MNKQFYLPLLMFFVFFFYSCSKVEEPSSPPETWPIDTTVLSYFYFNEGSYWVYKNDQTGQNDTQEVTKAIKEWIYWAQEKKYERATIEYTSTYEKSFYTRILYWDRCHAPYCCLVFSGKSDTTGGYGYSGTCHYPFIINETRNASIGSEYTVIDVYDSLTINRFTFKDVAQIRTTNAYFFKGQDVDFYWARGVGIVKRDFINLNESWSLIDYKLIK